MRKILITIGMYAFLIALAGCATESAVPSPLYSEDAPSVTDSVPAGLPIGLQTDEDQAVELAIEIVETAETKIPAQLTATETPQTSEPQEAVQPRESGTQEQTELPKQPEVSETPKQETQSQPAEAEKPAQTQPEPAKPVESPKEPEQPKPTEPSAPPATTESAPTDPPAPTEPPTPTESPAPVVTEPPVEAQPKTAYDFEFDINAIRADCIAIGQSMGYTLNTSLTSQSATWWNPVTASESNQGSALRSSLEQYIRFHTVANLGAYGLDEITEFNICCESRGGGAYAIYFVFA